MNPKEISEFYSKLIYISEFGILMTRLECLHYVRSFIQNSWENPTACGLVLTNDMHIMLNNDLQDIGYYCKDVQQSEGLYYHTVVRKEGLYEVSRFFKDLRSRGMLYVILEGPVDTTSDEPVFDAYNYDIPLKVYMGIPNELPSENHKVYRLKDSDKYIRAFRNSDDNTFLVYTELTGKNFELIADQPPVVF